MNVKDQLGHESYVTSIDETAAYTPGNTDRGLLVEVASGASSVGSFKLEDGATTTKGTINAANTARTTATTTLVVQAVSPQGKSPTYQAASVAGASTDIVGGTKIYKDDGTVISSFGGGTEATAGSAVVNLGSQQMLSDGTLAVRRLGDTSGRGIAVGAAAAGAAIAGNPVHIGGTDGTNARGLLVDTSGRQITVGAAADGAAVTGNPLLIGGQDGTNAQSLLTDTSGRPLIAGAAADGAAVTGNPVLLGTSDGTNTRTIGSSLVSTMTIASTKYGVHTKAILFMPDVSGTGAESVTSFGESDSASLAGSRMLATGSLPLLFNGSSYSRQRGNIESTVLSSSARTTTTNSSDQTNYNSRGVHVMINVSSIGTGDITPKIQGKDPVSSTYYDVLVGSSITSNGITILKVYPGIAAVANQSANDILPRTWRVVVTANNANSVTYSAGASLVV
jgi:hypothetical protein